MSIFYMQWLFVPLLRERGLPGLLSFLELEEVWELHREPSSSPELDDSSELDESSEKGLLLSRVAFCNLKMAHTQSHILDIKIHFGDTIAVNYKKKHFLFKFTSDQIDSGEMYRCYN